jgi:membrane-bound serine protease (ClpP class)
VRHAPRSRHAGGAGGRAPLACLVAAATLLVPPARAQADHVARIVVDGAINPAVSDFIHESIERAHGDGAAALVVELDTPGGLLSSTKSIVKDILGASVPVIVHVAPSGSGAGSAGVFITLAAHVAAMAPGTNIGAAHPVAGGGQDIGGDMREKLENFTASFSEAIAQKRGRNTEWAAKAVRESVSITEREALEKRVIDLIARDIDELLEKANGREVEVDGRKTTLDFAAVAGADGRTRVVTYDMRLKQRVLNVLSDPNIAYLLMMAGIIGLYFEFSHPGTIFPGVAGAICLLLALATFQILPINYTGLILILLGVVLLAAELFVPSGILGAGGVVAFVLGSLLLFDTPEAELMVDPAIVYSAGAFVLLTMLTLVWVVGSTLRRRPAVGMEGMIGEVGEVRSWSGREGHVHVHGEEWAAEGDESFSAGERIEVVAVGHGLRLRVRRAGTGGA